MLTIPFSLLAIIVAAIGVTVSIMVMRNNHNKNNNDDIRIRATETATINVKLDTIASDVKDIKYDITNVKNEVQALSERLVKCEESTKSAHHRLDQLAK